MVIATQNPIEQAGTYRLPEAQLDRFLMKTAVGYPDRAGHRCELLVERQGPRPGRRWSARSSPPAVIGEMSGAGRRGVRRPGGPRATSPSSPRSRAASPHVRLGLSARGCLALRPRAPRPGRPPTAATTCVPDDIKELAEPVLCHRLLLDAEAQFSGVDRRDRHRQAARRRRAADRPGGLTRREHADGARAPLRPASSTPWGGRCWSAGVALVVAAASHRLARAGGARRRLPAGASCSPSRSSSGARTSGSTWCSSPSA